MYVKQTFDASTFQTLRRFRCQVPPDFSMQAFPRGRKEIGPAAGAAEPISFCRKLNLLVFAIGMRMTVSVIAVIMILENPITARVTYFPVTNTIVNR